MTHTKIYKFLSTVAIFACAYIVSLIFAGYVNRKDTVFCQVAIYLSILIGMVLFYLAGLIEKKINALQ